MALYSGGDAGLMANDYQKTAIFDMQSDSVMIGENVSDGSVVANWSAVMDIGITILWTLSGDE